MALTGAMGAPAATEEKPKMAAAVSDTRRGTCFQDLQLAGTRGVYDALQFRLHEFDHLGTVPSLQALLASFERHVPYVPEQRNKKEWQDNYNKNRRRERERERQACVHTTYRESRSAMLGRAHRARAPCPHAPKKERERRFCPKWRMVVSLASLRKQEPDGPAWESAPPPQSVDSV